jgi:murein DD-endopeptidase MepM/ murein hydrolase activator NlpD
MPGPLRLDPSRPFNTPSAGTNTVTIKSGDTLSKIAQQHGVTVAAMVAANQAQFPQLATNPGAIKVGWQLTIPTLSSTPLPSTPATPANPGWSRPATGQATGPTGTITRPNDFGARLSAGGAQSIALRMQGHADAIEKTGVGTYFGDHSAWKTMTPDARKEWIAANAKPGATPATPQESSCIGWAMENVAAAYNAAGKGARWKEIQSTVVANGSKGTDLAKELKKDGWEAVYWNPDAKHPDDSNPEHSFSAVQVARGKGYYGVAVDHTVQNYRPTSGAGTSEDQSGTAKLNKVPFFFGLAKGGMHTFVGREGKVNEFHWSEMPNSTKAIEERPLKDFPWNSGLIMVPPGSWPKE